MASTHTFSIDPIGTSASRLSWPDAWYLHGWNGGSPPAAGVRITYMAAVEAVSRELLFPSIGEQLDRVAESLDRQNQGAATARSGWTPGGERS